jgi:hypothetical protein
MRPKPYIKAGHFSAKIPGQLSAEINTRTLTGLIDEPAIYSMKQPALTDRARAT